MLPVVNEWELGEVRGQSPTLVSREALEGPLLSLSTRTQPECLPNSLFSVSRKRKKSCEQPEPGFLGHGEFSGKQSRGAGFQSHGPRGLCPCGGRRGGSCGQIKCEYN